MTGHSPGAMDWPRERAGPVPGALTAPPRSRGRPQPQILLRRRRHIPHFRHSRLANKQETHQFRLTIGATALARTQLHLQFDNAPNQPLRAGF